MAADDLDFGATVKGFSPGQKLFNRYVLKKILGRGGMGVVWLAHDEELERGVALKFLPEIVTHDPEAITDLKRETRRNLELTHPNIVRIYDFVTDTRAAAISMEFVDGATLTALKLERPGRVFGLDELRPWLVQLVDALHYAHTRPKIVHRDLKPANLMVTRAGELKVTDFGIARGISDSVSRVSAHAGSSGTPVYMSPQQMMGERPAVADDIYAFGATLYELLTGKPPFYSGNVILQVQSKTAPSLAERRAEFGITGEAVPTEWEQTIAACLAKEPGDRPASIREAAARLGLVTGGGPAEPVRAKPAAPGPVAEPPPLPAETAKPRPRGVPMWLVAVLLGVLAVGGAGAWWFGLHLPERRRLSELQRQADEADRIAREAAAARQREEALAAGRSQLQQIRNNLRQLSAAADQYFLEYGKNEVAVADLLGPEAYIRELRSVRGESYLGIGVIRQGAPFHVRTNDGWVFRNQDGEIEEVAKGSELSVTAVGAATGALPRAGQAWRNSRDRSFVPIPGTKVLVAVHETTVADFRLFVDETRQEWTAPSFPQEPDHPAVNLTWHQAKAYCAWLTDRERAAGKLGPNQRYRLPTDAEWSLAVGLRDESGATPQEKDGQVADVYPWGAGAWPPPPRVANLPDQSLLRADEMATVVENAYDDGYAHTSPVGAFPATANGLHDLSGNVWEFCEDVYRPGEPGRVLRGGSFGNAGIYLNYVMLSSYRNVLDPAAVAEDAGFRVVLETEPSR